jgi:hypothetical protein
MKTFRLSLVAIATFLLVVIVVNMDFSNLSWKNNHSDFIGIISSLLLIISMLLSNRNDRKV